jgi:hypothetical protein
MWVKVRLEEITKESWCLESFYGVVVAEFNVARMNKKGQHLQIVKNL